MQGGFGKLARMSCVVLYCRDSRTVRCGTVRILSCRADARGARGTKGRKRLGDS
jgi:hypothetical protein